MPLIPPETIEQIQSANDIVDVVEGYFPLKRAAGMFKATCPFHAEKTPSFSVNPKRQIFKCFGCGAGGNVIRFVMMYENLDFVSAARKLAERAGIKIVEAEMSPEDAARFTMRRRLLALHAEAADFFHHQLLRKPSAQVAREYLKGRGITVEVAKAWKIGYAPDSYEAFGNFAHDRGFSDEETVQSGLVKLRDEENPRGGFFDRFRGRVMFPIHNHRTGEVIAFSGRVLDAEAKAAKYVNSPETPLFTKGKVLYGLHKTMRAVIDKAQAIVCEGQLDLITAYEAGVQNVIAPQGTAFTKEQAHILKQYVGEGEVVLCFDADTAGQNAAEKSLEMLLAENLTVRMVEMPRGEDPDSLIRREGAGAFVERVAAAQEFFDFQLARMAASTELATPGGKRAAARKVMTWANFLTDGILREAIVNKASQRLEVSTAELSRMLKAPKTTRDDEVERPEPVALDPTLRLLAIVTLCDDDARAWVLEEPWNEVLAREPDAALLSKILAADLQPSDQPSINTFLTTLDAAEEAAICDLLEEKRPNPVAVAHACWRELEQRHTRRKIEAIKARLRTPELGAEDVLKWQKQILDLQKRLSDIARPFSPLL